MRHPARAAALVLAETVQRTPLRTRFMPAEPDQLRDLQRELDLSVPLLEWYTVAAPRNFAIPSAGKEPPLHGPADLRDALSWYRYDPVTGEELQTWDPTWLVIGGEPDYPLIARTARALDQALYCGVFRDEGWQLRMLSTTLEGFLLGVSDYVELYFESYHGQIHDEHYVLKPSFRAELCALLDRRPGTLGRGADWLQLLLGF